MHTIAILALDGVVVFDLSIPIETFGRARRLDGTLAYQIFVCAPTSVIDTGMFSLHAQWSLEKLRKADTIILPGIADIRRPIFEDVLSELRRCAADGIRIASICSGAFILAATGLLDGLNATTHWAAANDLAQCYPTIAVDPDVLFIDNGQFLTSAGAAAGLDLCLYMIRQDYGGAIASAVAKAAVMPLEREGGQAQFIRYELPIPDGTSLEPLLRWMVQNMDQELALSELASKAMMSRRTLSRRFREQTGTTPLQWLCRVRLYQAQALLETTNHPVEKIASLVGFGSSTAFRDQFKRFFSVSPQAYRRSFHWQAPGEPSPLMKIDDQNGN
jgi:transcriptional regulator GlxA family with amidase domain